MTAATSPDDDDDDDDDGNANNCRRLSGMGSVQEKVAGELLLSEYEIVRGLSRTNGWAGSESTVICCRLFSPVRWHLSIKLIVD